MRPLSQALLRAVPGVRRVVVALGVAGVVSGVLAIAQAVTLAVLVVRLVDGGDLTSAVRWLAAVLLARGLVAAATRALADRAGTRVATQVRMLALRRWADQPADVRPHQAHLLTRATSGATSVEPYVAHYLPALVCAAVLPPLAVLALLVTDWPSALIVVVTLPLLPVFAALIGKHTQQETERRWRSLSVLSGHFLDVLKGLPTLASYQRAEAQVGVVQRVGDRHRRATVRTLRVAFLSSAALELLATISVAMVAVCVGLRLAYGAMPLQVALTAILLTPEAYWPIRRVGQEFHAAADGAAALDELLPTETRGKPTEKRDRPTEKCVVPTETGGMPIEPRVVPLETCDPHVTLTYRYPGTDRFVLRGLRVPLHHGLTVLTGPSGCGKTTALELLAGLRINQSDGTAPTPHPAHLVTQRPLLAPMTIGDNLRLGAGPVTDAQIRQAAEHTGLDLPLDTMLGDDGMGLSAGQRALVALSRAALSEAPLVLLDEPTAHLDRTVAEHVRQVIVDLARHRSVVAATHDPALMSLAHHHLDLTPVPA